MPLPRSSNVNNPTSLIYTRRSIDGSPCMRQLKSFIVHSSSFFTILRLEEFGNERDRERNLFFLVFIDLEKSRYTQENIRNKNYLKSSIQERNEQSFLRVSRISFRHLLPFPTRSKLVHLAKQAWLLSKVRNYESVA